MIFFTSDMHFGRDEEFIYKKRGFSSCKEHDETIIKNWNRVVSDKDEVYVLGDVADDADYGVECLKRLNGRIFIVPGNHDTQEMLFKYAELPNVAILDKMAMVHVGTEDKWMCHYPIMFNSWRRDDFEYRGNVASMFGHTHSTELFYEDDPYMYNVAVDAHDCTPVSCKEISKDVCAKIAKIIVARQASSAS